MPSDPIDIALTHIQEITGSSPRLKDLFKVRELWLRLQKFWGLLSEETLRRRANCDTIRVVDFDIIYPAFWQSARLRPATQRPTSIEARFGFPMTTDFVFRHTKRPFTIPPGALFEVARHLIHLEQSYRTSNSKLAQIVENIESEGAPGNQSVAQYALAVSKEIGPEVEREVDQLIEMGVRLRSLKSILDHPFYRPWQDIVEKVGAQVEPEDVLRLRNLFNVIRPNRKFNNYLDALNVASYHTLLGSRDIDEQFTAVFPVLASGTKMILQYTTSTSAGANLRPVTLTDDAIQPVSTQYLSFATAAEVYSEDNLMLLASMTKENRAELFNLLGAWDTFWFDWGSRFQTMTPKEIKDIEEIPLEDLADVVSFRELCAGYSKWKFNFVDIIGQTFIEITRTDRRLSENFKLIRKRLVGSLKQGKYGSNLIDYGELTAFTWNQKASSVDSYLLLQHELGASNQEITLKALKDTGILQERKFILPRARPTLHINVNLLHISETVFTWERAVESNQQLCSWGYNRNLEDTLELTKHLLQQPYISSEVRVCIFAEGVYEKQTLEVQSPVESWLSSIISATSNPEYIKIESDYCTIFCDVAPAFESGYSEIAVLYSDERLHAPIADFHNQSANSTLAPQLVSALLRRYALDFPKREEDIKKAREEAGNVEVSFE